ncbi:MAG TPA: DUF2127 domain-containing protein [Burkholderiales bacterium]|nr:DUF2127 domain-containing protein [Burkholderiales bacterium]
MASRGVRIVAVVEAAKGVLVLVAGLGLFELLHRDVQAIAERIVEHFHLNPASRTPRILLDAAGALTDGRLVALAMGAIAYSMARFIEAYGLWRELRWAEWFAVAAGGLYIPIELYELARRVTWIRFGLLAVNIAIVVYLARVLWRTRREAAHE